MNKITQNQKGSQAGWMIATIVLGVLVVGVGGLAGYIYIQYKDNKTFLDEKVSKAVLESNKEQADKLEKDFAEREKLPTRTFAGPEDFGRLTFSYPKTWSVYVEDDGSDRGDYEAYMHPITVPTIDDKTPYALRIKILNEDYDKVISSYDELVKKGDLKSSATVISGVPAVRLEGKFSQDLQGYMILFRVRDKTVTLQSNAEIFKEDFDKLLETVTINT